MKAIHLTRNRGPDALKIARRNVPAPDPGEALVRVCVTSVNDWDLAMSHGSPFCIRLLSGHTRTSVTVPDVDESGKVCPLIDGPFNLENTAAAVEHFASGKHVGKVVIGDQR